MSKADITGGTGPASSLFINTIPKPKAKGSQAMVKVKAFGLNRMDLLQREGRYPVPPQAGPILGVEFSGIIENFGSEPERGFKQGDEVFGLAYGGQSHIIRDPRKALRCEKARMQSTLPYRHTCSFTSRRSCLGSKRLGSQRLLASCLPPSNRTNVVTYFRPG